MRGIRQALAVTTTERYINIVGHLAMTITVSRLLTPAEIGVWAIGLATATTLLAVREFSPGIFLIQRANLTPEDARGAFTVMLLMTIAVAGVLAVSAPWLADFYGKRELLLSYLHVAAFAIILEAVAAPLVALMRRDMAFTDLAIVNIANAATFAIASVALATLGFSYMSFAWAWVMGAAVSGGLAIYYRPDVWVFRPLLRGWQDMLTFGGYNGVNVLLFRLYEALPTLILGKVVSFDTAGLYNRALLVCQVPDKVVLGGAIPVFLPAFSAEVRAGRSLKGPYLLAVSFITALQWPVLIVLAILAHPVVSMVLGEQWLQVVPLVQILAIASLFSFAAELNFPVLVSVGAIRDLLLRGLIAWPISALLIASAGLLGLNAVALSFLVIIPLQAFVSLHFVRRHVPVSLSELGEACWRSAIIAACSAAGPLCVAAWQGFHFDMTVPAALVASLLAGTGWLVAVRFTGHPLLNEIVLAANIFSRFSADVGRRAWSR